MRLSGLFTLLFWSSCACFVIAGVLDYARIAGYALLFSFFSLALSATFGLREACLDLDGIRARRAAFDNEQAGE